MCTYVLMNKHIPTQADTQARTCTYTYAGTHMHTHTYAGTHVHTHTGTHVHRHT